MTISSSTRKAGPFTGNGVTTSFPFTFKVFTASDLYVVLADTSTGIETVQTLTTNYTVSLNADQNANPGGSVVMLTAPAAGYTLTLTSAIAQTQAVDLQNAGGFYPSVINSALDKLTILIQQVTEKVDRALLSAVSSVTPAKLPAPAATKVLAWNAAGTDLENVDMIAGQSALATALAAPTGSSLVGFIQSGTGAVATTVQTKLRESVSVKDFGAVGDGVANDTTAITKALASIQSTGGALFFPRGTYLTDAIDLRGYKNVTLHGDNEYSEFQYQTTSVIKIRTSATTGIKLADDNLEVPVSLATGIVLQNLAIDGNNLATTAINMCRAVKMINCKVTGAVQDGIVFEGGSYPIHLQNVVSQGNGRDGLRVKAPFTTVYSIRDCEFGYNGGNGVTIFDGSTATFDSVLCQSNTGNGFHIQRLDPAGYTQPIFLERLKFSTCYSEANAGWGIYVDSYNNTPTTYTGKIVDLSFINSSFNSGVSKQARLRGLTAPNIIGSPYLAAALDPAYNTVLLDRAAEYGELPWTARISQSQTNYFTTSGTTSAIYQRVGNWINCFITYSWSNKGSASSVFYAIIDELPFIAAGGTFVQPATACSIQVAGGSTDIWHIVPRGGEKTARLIKNNKDDYALISDLPASGTLTAQFSYLAA